MTRFLLIRHGESEANRMGFFAGQMDVKLLEKGEKQAKITAQYLAESKMGIERVYASDLQRAYKTGEIIAGVLNAELFASQGLREIYSGKWQGKRFEDIIRDFPDSYDVWLNDIGNCVCPDGESVRELGSRVINELEKIAIANCGKTLVIATHATPIRAIQCTLSGKSYDEMKHIPWVSNASVSEIIYDNGMWKTVRFGYDEHLKEYKTSFGANV